MLIIGRSLAAVFPAAPEAYGGLYFHSHQVIKDKRTSLKIGHATPLIVSKGINLDFQLNLRDERTVFGYVCRMILNDSTNIDILSSNFEGEDALWLVFGTEKKQLLLLRDIPGFTKGEWINVRLSYLPLALKIEMSLNTATLTIALTDKSVNYTKFAIYFGVNSHPRFFTSDAAPIVVKNIVISDHTEKKLFHWTLREHGGYSITDKLRKSEAIVENPLWLADKHINWELIDSVTLSIKPSIAFSEKTSSLYVVNPERMVIFDLKKPVAHKDTIFYKNGGPFETLANQLIYNNFTNELWSYDLDGTGISKYNFNTNRWNLQGGKPMEPTYWHHNRIISPIDSSLLCFGGYGYYMYHSILQKYDFDSTKWKKVSLIDQIQPRYLSAATLHNKTLYVFGGFGNKTGEQQLSPHSFCDLYTISLSDYSVKKKWDVPEIYEGMVYSQSLVMDTLTSSLYVLGYYGQRFNTWIRLYKLSTEEPGLVALADSIPYQFSDTESFSDLYFMPEANCFVTATIHRTIQNRFQVKVYKLNFPAFPIDEIIQQDASIRKFIIRDISIWQAILIVILFLSFGVILGLIINSMRKKKTRKGNIIDDQPGFDYLNSGEKLYEISPNRALHASSINLLGGFQAINKHGVDITAQFTPTIRYLLLLIILYTFKNKKGISSAMLIEILWFDKSETSAKNNRNVNLKKLRTLLEEFEGIDINNDNSYWHCLITPPFYCDYAILLELAADISGSKEEPVTEKIDLFISLVSQGLLLPNIQNEWVDSFKAEYASLVIDLLQQLAKKTEQANDYKRMLRIANALLVQDSIDEDALVLKCKALIATGKKSTAMTFYTNFCRNYKMILNDEFPIPFSAIL